MFWLWLFQLHMLSFALFESISGVCVGGVVPVESHLFSLCELLVHRTEVLLRLQEMGAARVKVSTKTSVIFFLGYVEHRGTLN